MVNYVMKGKDYNSSYKAGIVNHAMMNKTAKSTDTIFVWDVQWAPSTKQMKTD